MVERRSKFTCSEPQATFNRCRVHHDWVGPERSMQWRPDPPEPQSIPLLN